ncbi:hypothetical protein UPYG_G00168690 [Umbra pygmaea]|uniref:Ig-like domain-containing protein n=1 Tax=Umbra pygmaea TaxID=75934 RepID=A0ABD0WPP6_UMBPY
MFMSVCLISSVLHITAGCTLSGPEVTQITVYSGRLVMLPCSCSEPDAKPEYVRWTVNQGDHRDQEVWYITEKDDALYRCKINGSSFKDIRLHVKGCTLSGPERSEITASLGQSVILPCSCTETQAKPHSFTWTVGSMLTISEIWSSLGSNWSHVYRHRVQLSSNSPGDLSLLLSNFTHRDEGLYACKITTHNTTDHRLLFLTELKKGQGYSRRFPYSHIALIVFFTLPLTAGCYAWRTLKKKLCEDTAHQQHM